MTLEDNTDINSSAEKTIEKAAENTTEHTTENTTEDMLEDKPDIIIENDDNSEHSAQNDTNANDKNTNASDEPVIYISSDESNDEEMLSEDSDEEDEEDMFFSDESDDDGMDEEGRRELVEFYIEEIMRYSGKLGGAIGNTQRSLTQDMRGLRRFYEYMKKTYKTVKKFPVMDDLERLQA